MKNNFIHLATFFVLSILAACGGNQQTGTSAADGAHNSQNALDWDGAYRGIIPCADCPGIQTTVYLNKDLTYRMTMKYLEREGAQLEYTGKFSWNDKGNTITLESNSNQTTKFFVGENTLTQLDEAGNKITGEIATEFILTKSNFDILEKYWKLTELEGQPVTVESGMGREPHIILKEADNRVNGNGGCNAISGSVEVRSINRIKFSQMMSTLMACPSMQTEQNFLKALQEADSYTLSGDDLSLNKGEQVLARFKAVYMN